MFKHTFKRFEIGDVVTAVKTAEEAYRLIAWLGFCS